MQKYNNIQKIGQNVFYFNKIIITYIHEWWEQKTHDGPYKNSLLKNNSIEIADLLLQRLESKIKK